MSENQQLAPAIPPKPYASPEIIDHNKKAAYEFMNPERWALMKTMAATFSESGALPASIKNGHQMVMVIQAGFECGLQPIESLNSFYFVNGKISLFGEVAISMVRRAGHKIKWGTCNDITATCEITRCDTGESLEQTFTMKMAIDRGLTKKGGAWASAPDNMLKFKAFWACARFLVPDALHGVKGKEELEDIVEGVVVSDMKPEQVKEINQPNKIESPRKSLEEALNEPTPEVEEEKPKKVKKVKEVEPEKVEEVKPEEVKTEPKEEVKTESESQRRMREGMEKGKAEAQEQSDKKARYDSLIDKELNGEELTAEEIVFCNNFTQK